MILNIDNNRSDGVAHAFISNLNVDIPIVLVSRSERLDFNESILSLAGKKWIMIDYTELGWDWDMEFGHHFGVNTDKFPGVFDMDKWNVFDDFVKDNLPELIFCRELLKSDVSEKLLPIQYPCFISSYPAQTKEQFDNRILQTFYSFGISHEYRKELHGKIWAKSGQYGYSVCDNLFLFNQFVNEERGSLKWLSVHIPHWARQPVETILQINELSKISISIAGAGRTCFRHAESPVNSVMLMWEDEIAWNKGMEWVHNENCIKCKQGEEVEAIVEALKNPNLYDIYLAGMINVDKYRFNNYLPYLENIINKA